MAAVALAGCPVDNTPTSYTARDGIVGRNYVDACTGRVQNDSSTTTSMNNQALCECQFEVFQANVPYNGDDRSRLPAYPEDKPTFQDLDSALRGDPNRINDLPQDVRTKLDACKTRGQVGPVAGGAGTTSTSAPAAASTTTTAATTTSS